MFGGKGTQLVPMVEVMGFDAIMVYIPTNTIGAFSAIILRKSIQGLNEVKPEGNCVGIRNSRGLSMLQKMAQKVEEKNTVLGQSFRLYSKGNESTSNKQLG